MCPLCPQRITLTNYQSGLAPKIMTFQVNTLQYFITFEKRMDGIRSYFLSNYSFLRKRLDDIEAFAHLAT